MEVVKFTLDETHYPCFRTYHEHFDQLQKAMHKIKCLGDKIVVHFTGTSGALLVPILFSELKEDVDVGIVQYKKEGASSHRCYVENSCTWDASYEHLFIDDVYVTGKTFRFVRERSHYDINHIFLLDCFYDISTIKRQGVETLFMSSYYFDNCAINSRNCTLYS